MYPHVCGTRVGRVRMVQDLVAQLAAYTGFSGRNVCNLLESLPMWTHLSPRLSDLELCGLLILTATYSCSPPSNKILRVLRIVENMALTIDSGEI